MILDGYSRHIRLYEESLVFNVWYRPSPLFERVASKSCFEFLGEQAGRMKLCEWVAGHIVCSDIRNMHSDPARGVRLFLSEYPRLFETLLQAIFGKVVDSSGERWQDVEEQWKQNLFEGVVLERVSPKIARRSCEDCKKYWYSEETGEILVENSTGKKKLRGDGLTLCQSEEGCPKGTPEKQKSLNRANRRALQFHLQCKAVGEFPNDAIVRVNAAVIERALSKRLK